MRPHSIPELSLTGPEYSLLHYPENGPEPMDPPIRPLSLDHALPDEGTEGLRRGMGLEHPHRYPALCLGNCVSVGSRISPQIRIATTAVEFPIRGEVHREREPLRFSLHRRSHLSRPTHFHR